MVVKAVYINCKNLKFSGVNVIHACVVHFCVYLGRESNVESLCLVRLDFSFRELVLYL